MSIVARVPSTGSSQLPDAYGLKSPSGATPLFGYWPGATSTV